MTPSPSAPYGGPESSPTLSAASVFNLTRSAAASESPSRSRRTRSLHSIGMRFFLDTDGEQFSRIHRSCYNSFDRRWTSYSRSDVRHPALSNFELGLRVNAGKFALTPNAHSYQSSTSH